MAYSAPKWTQMTAPSGTTSVNALTSAGDLFSKAMDAASDGLKSYDKGVESRLQEDSDVNTAALRRRLESATDLDSLNAMQGDISASGLEGYGKRIDADALSASFDKEQGVMRNEFQQEFNENFSQRMAESKTPEDFAARQAELTQANTDNSFLDISGQITSVADASRSAKEKRTQQETIQFGLDNRGKSYADLTTAIGTIKGVDEGAVGKRAALESEQKVALARETQKVSEDLALLDAGITDMTGRKAYNVALAKAQEKYPQVNFSQLISDAKKSTEEQRNQDATGVTNSLYLEALNLSSISDIEKLSGKIDTNGPFFAQQTKILEDRKKVVFADQQATFERDVAQKISDAASKGQGALNKLRDEISSKDFVSRYGTQINIGNVDALFQASNSRAAEITATTFTTEFNFDRDTFNTKNSNILQEVINSIPGANQFATIDANGNYQVDSEASNEMRKTLNEAIEASDWQKSPTPKAAEALLREQLVDRGLNSTQQDNIIELNASIAAEATEISDQFKTGYDADILASSETMTRSIDQAKFAYDSIQDHPDFLDELSATLDDGQTAKDFAASKYETNFFPDWMQWDGGRSAVINAVQSIQSGDTIIRDANDQVIDPDTISEFILKSSLEIALQGNSKVDNEAAFIRIVAEQVAKNSGDVEFNRKKRAYSLWKETEVTAGLQHTARKSSILGKYQSLSGVRSNANTVAQMSALQVAISPGNSYSLSQIKNNNTNNTNNANQPNPTGNNITVSALQTPVPLTAAGLRTALTTVGKQSSYGNYNAKNQSTAALNKALDKVLANNAFPSSVAGSPSIPNMKALLATHTSTVNSGPVTGRASTVNKTSLGAALVNLNVKPGDVQRVIDYLQSL